MAKMNNLNGAMKPLTKQFLYLVSTWIFYDGIYEPDCGTDPIQSSEPGWQMTGVQHILYYSYQGTPEYKKIFKSVRQKAILKP